MFIYFTSAVAETNRAPFDLPEAEQELIAGYHTEYSSFRFAMFFMGEYVAMVIVSLVATTLFFGGWHGPFVHTIPWLGIIWFLIKALAVLYLYIWIRGTWPRVRYDQLMRLGWKFNIPVALINILVTSLVLVIFPRPAGSPWPSMTATWVLTAINIVMGIVLFFLVSAALKHSAEYLTRRGQRWTGGMTFEVLSGRREE
jgi:NADH-quinone oxidoreductase subunit H